MNKIFPFLLVISVTLFSSFFSPKSHAQSSASSTPSTSFTISSDRDYDSGYGHVTTARNSVTWYGISEFEWSVVEFKVSELADNFSRSLSSYLSFQIPVAQTVFHDDLPDQEIKYGVIDVTSFAGTNQVAHHGFYTYLYDTEPMSFNLMNYPEKSTVTMDVSASFADAMSRGDEYIGFKMSTVDSHLKFTGASNIVLLDSFYLSSPDGSFNSITAVPEPSTYAFLAIGLALIFINRRIFNNRRRAR